MESAISFGELVRRFRKYNDYTQAETAKRLGYSEETIKSWEQGRRFPAREEVARLADLMEMDAQEVKHTIQIGRSRVHRKDHFTSRDFSKEESNFDLIDTVPLEVSRAETTLDDAAFRLMQIQLIASIYQWDLSAKTYYELQQLIEQRINMFGEKEKQISEETSTLSRRQAMAVLAMLPVALLESLQQARRATVIPEELLPQ